MTCGVGAAVFLAVCVAWNGETQFVEANRCKVRIGLPVAQGTPLISMEQFDHSDFDCLLRRFVDCDGLVAYRQWKSDPSAMTTLRCYLERFALLDYESGERFPKHRLATLINGYNALVIWGILREYPTVSIQAHNKDGACYRIFDDLEVCLAGEYVSLNGIEHGLLRPLGDPRIHFAIVCAARGCPRLRNEAFVADQIDRQLDENGFEFFSKPKRWKTHRLLGHAAVSPILKWFREDFGHCDHDVLQRVFHYLPSCDQQWIARRGRVPLKYLGYDWSLNDRDPPPFQRAAAIPYSLFATVEPTVRPIMGLVKRDTPQQSTANSSPPVSAEPGSTSSAEPAPPALPSGDEDAPPPIRLKEETKKKSEADTQPKTPKTEANAKPPAT
jgi:hypothetical protein